MRIRHLVTIGAMAGALSLASTAQSQDFNQYLGGIWLFGGTFCPRGSVEAEGQLMQISQNQALFSLLGTSYGGDGRTTFALPDLRLADDPKFGALRYCVNLEGIFPSRS